MSTIAAVQAVYKSARETALEAAKKAAEEAQVKSKTATFKAVGVDHGVIIGIGASIAVDREDEMVEKGALIGLAYDFCASDARTFKANHDDDAVLEAELVCSWPGAPILKSGEILEAGAEVPADDPIVGINIEKGQETHWFVGVRPKDAEIVKAAEEGKIAGFSWGGYAVKEAA